MLSFSYAYFHMTWLISRLSRRPGTRPIRIPALLIFWEIDPRFLLRRWRNPVRFADMLTFSHARSGAETRSAAHDGDVSPAARNERPVWRCGGRFAAADRTGDKPEPAVLNRQA